MTVTYHDPCHLGRQGEPYVPWDGEETKIYGQAVVYDPPRPRYNGAQGVYEAPRDVLAAIPGLELVEMERNREAAWCCGAGGACREAYPEFSAWAASERIEEAEATGAEAIVTACSRCELNFAEAVAARCRRRLAGPRRARARRASARRRKGGDDDLRPHPRGLPALEDIVGAEHVSDDPAVLDGYAFQYLAELVRPEHSPLHAAAGGRGHAGAAPRRCRPSSVLANRHGLEGQGHRHRLVLLQRAHEGRRDPTPASSTCGA